MPLKQKIIDRYSSSDNESVISRADDWDKQADRPTLDCYRGRHISLKRKILWIALLSLTFIAYYQMVAGLFGNSSSATTRSMAIKEFPDEEMKSFALRFANAYLTQSPDNSEDQTKIVESFMMSDLRGVQTSSMNSQAQQVLQSWVARTKKISDFNALITVASIIKTKKKTSTIYLSIPVLKNKDMLVIDDYPAIVSPPTVASSAPMSNEQVLPEEEAKPIQSMLTRFMREYLGGGLVAPEFIVPGQKIDPLNRHLELKEIVSLSLASRPYHNQDNIIATVLAKDIKTKTEYPLRYIICVELRDRWLVRNIQN